MPLTMKTLREASAELGIPEAEIKALVDSKKIRAVFKKGQPTFAPDELAKIARLRKSLPESAKKASAPEPVVPPKPVLPKPFVPRRPPPSRRFGP